jgi:hypothetical protein
MGTQYHLTRFAFLYETTVVGEGSMLSPMGADDGPWYFPPCCCESRRPLTSAGPPGLKSIFEAIDNRTDFKSYMQNYAVARGTPRGPRREGPYEEGFVSSIRQAEPQILCSARKVISLANSVPAAATAPPRSKVHRCPSIHADQRSSTRPVHLFRRNNARPRNTRCVRCDFRRGSRRAARERWSRGAESRPEVHRVYRRVWYVPSQMLRMVEL